MKKLLYLLFAVLGTAGFTTYVKAGITYDNQDRSEKRFSVRPAGNHDERVTTIYPAGNHDERMATIRPAGNHDE